MLTLPAMRTFVAVVEEGSFTRAAERLNATQSGVSQQIAKLERGTGVPLLVRAAMGVVPTPAGRQLYQRCLSLLHDAAATEASLRTYADGLVGEVRFGLMPALTRCVLGPMLRRFRADHPNTTVRAVEAVSSDLVARVQADQLDLAVVPVSDVPDGIRCETLCTVGEVLVARGADDPRHMEPVDLAAVGPLRLLLQSAGNVRRHRILARLKSRGVAISEVIELDSMFGTLEYVANSNVMTILPDVMMLPEIQDRTISIRPISDPGFAFEVMAIHPRRRPASATAAALMAEFTDQLAKTAAAIDALRRAPPLPKRSRRRRS